MTTTSPLDEIEEVSIDSLNPYPGNAKRHDVPMLRRSLRRAKQYRPAVVQRSTRNVLVGNGMVQAAIEEGWTTIRVVWLDVDDDEARRVLLLDNRLPELGGQDVDALVALLQQAPTLDGTGWTDETMADLIAATTIPTFAEEDPDTQPRLDEKNPLECPSCHHRWVP